MRLPAVDSTTVVDVLAAGATPWDALNTALREAEQAAVGGPAQQVASVARQRLVTGELVRVVG